MSRMKTAEHLALTDPYWSAYLDGLHDRRNVRDNDDVAHHVEVNRLLKARVDRYEEEEARRARREPWDNDWEPVVQNAADLGAPRVP